MRPEQMLPELADLLDAYEADSRFEGWTAENFEDFFDRIEGLDPDEDEEVIDQMRAKASPEHQDALARFADITAKLGIADEFKANDRPVLTPEERRRRWRVISE